MLSIFADKNKLQNILFSYFHLYIDNISNILFDSYLHILQFFFTFIMYIIYSLWQRLFFKERITNIIKLLCLFFDFLFYLSYFLFVSGILQGQFMLILFTIYNVSFLVNIN